MKPGATSVDAGKLGKLNVVNGSEILLGAPYIFDKGNIGKFDFRFPSPLSATRAGRR